jgi:outer membrane protein assembly factor BamB
MRTPPALLLPAALLVVTLLILLSGCGAPVARERVAGADDPAPAPADGNEPSPPGASTNLLSAESVQTTWMNDRQPPAGDLRTRTFGADWPRFLGPTGDSKSTEVGILTIWGGGRPRIVWQCRLGTGYAAPVTSRGRLYMHDRFGPRARLTCFKSETGEELWRFEYDTDYDDMFGYNNGPRCCPVVDDDRVYILGAEGKLFCVDALTGKPHWGVDTQREFGVVQNFFGVGSTPIVEGDLVIVQVGGSPPDCQDVPPGALDRVRGNGSGVVAFEKRTGKVKYKFSDELASYSSPVVATIGERRWCFIWARGGLLGFEPATGKLDFHFPWRATDLESVNASNPVVVGDEVLISEAYGVGSALLRVGPGKYEVVWDDKHKRRNKSLMTHWNTPVAVDGYVYASSGRHSGDAELRCVEWATGQVQWAKEGLGRSSLLYVDGHFVCLAEFGELYLLKANPRQYQEVAAVVLTATEAGPSLPGFGPRPLLKYPAWAAPVLSHGLLYVRGEDRLVCLDLIPQK